MGYLCSIIGVHFLLLHVCRIYFCSLAYVWMGVWPLRFAHISLFHATVVCFSFLVLWIVVPRVLCARGTAEGLGSHSFMVCLLPYCVPWSCSWFLFPVGLSGLLGWFGLLCAFQVSFHDVLGRFFTATASLCFGFSGLTCGNGRALHGSYGFTSSEGDIVFGSLLVCVVSFLLSLDFLGSFCDWIPVSRSLVVDFDFPGCLVPCCSWCFSSDLAWCSALALFFLNTVRCGPLLHGTSRFLLLSLYFLPLSCGCSASWFNISLFFLLGVLHVSRCCRSGRMSLTLALAGWFPSFFLPFMYFCDSGCGWVCV